MAGRKNHEHGGHESPHALEHHVKGIEELLETLVRSTQDSHVEKWLHKAAADRAKIISLLEQILAKQMTCYPAPSGGKITVT